MFIDLPLIMPKHVLLQGVPIAAVDVDDAARR